MTHLPHAARQDANQDEIVDALERYGWTVWKLGLPVDLLIMRDQDGIWLAEVKKPGKIIYTPTQLKIIKSPFARRFVTFQSVDDVVKFAVDVMAKRDQESLRHN